MFYISNYIYVTYACSQGVGFGGGDNSYEFGDGSGESIGYRGKGYNPNFDNADEYPPSQEPVQSTRAPIDLSKKTCTIILISVK